MAPKRKLKSVNKRSISEASPEIDFGSSSTAKQLKLLAKKMGPQWTRGELERFYYAYREHQRHWKKVAAAVRNNRSVDMVKALFYFNRAYLSLPEGTASVAGFIAMMSDHYSTMGEIVSEGEGHDASGGPMKHQKCRRGKNPQSAFREAVIPSQSVASAEGCLLFLRQTQAYGIERRACRKRTARIEVPSTSERDGREGSTPPNKRAKEQWDDDDGSRRGGGSPYRGIEFNDSTPIRLRKMSQAKDDQSKYRDSIMFENGMRTSRDKKYKKGVSDRDVALLMNMQGVSTANFPQKGKNVRVEEAERNDSDNNRESCNANEELRIKPSKGMVYFEASRDEFETLQALNELSASFPRAGMMESEPSAQLKEDRIPNNVDDNTPETISSSLHREKATQAGLLHAISDGKPTSVDESVDGNAVSIGEYGTSRRKRKPKVLGVETLKDSVQDKPLYSKELAEDVNLKSLVKARGAGQVPPKQLDSAKTLEESFLTGQDAPVSATQVSGPGPASLAQKLPNRRKMSLKKNLQERAKSSETTHDKPHSYRIFSEHELSKEKVSTCLSNSLVRRRCIYEWFYSAIDYPWYAKTEFSDYVNHAGLSNIQRLTRPEWSIIRSSLGRPKRFSERFIQSERDKLEEHRESVRKHYTELRADTDFAEPLSVGNRVIAIHPKTREIRDGKILTVDHDKCKVLFDELGVELVMDIDCMPLNPSEYMPEGLRRQIDKCVSMNNEAHFNRHPNPDASVLFAPSVLENVNFSTNSPIKQDDINRPILHGQVLATDTTDQYITTNSKARGPEIERALVLQHTSDVLEMEPEMVEIFSGSKSKAQEMVDAAMKVRSSMKKDEDAGNIVLQALNLIGGEHKLLYNSLGLSMKHQEHSNGSLDHHQSRPPTNSAEPMANGFISQDGSGNNETQMTSELITSCVAIWLMIKMCAEKQYPPGEVAQLMEKAVNGLQPRCPQNMAIYRDIQTYMGWIKTRIMALVRT